MCSGSIPGIIALLAGQKVAELYHCNGLIVKRTVYVIGPDGKIRFAKRGMPAPAEVLAAA